MPRLSYIGLRDLIMLVPLGFLIFERFYTTTMTVLEESNSNTVVSAEHESLLPLLMSYDLQKESRTTRNDRRRRRPVPLELLSNATAATTMTCPDGLVSIQDRHIPDNNNLQSSSSRLIPRVVHQTSKSRCMTEKMAEITKSWLLLEEEEDSSISWDYYFHDDHAMQALFDLDWPEFPHLHSILACLQHSGTMRADLWRYLVLYEYGGIYADLDTKPSAKFHASMITNTTDGFFVVEQYHILSQWFMAMSPRHPLMYYTIQHALLNILSQLDVRNMKAPYVTGPHALLHGYATFMADNSNNPIVPRTVPGNKCVKAGIYKGTNNRSITVVGVGENEKEFVIREAIPRSHKMKEYAQMGMKHFLEQEREPKREGGRKICLSAIYYQQQDDEK